MNVYFVAFKHGTILSRVGSRNCLNGESLVKYMEAYIISRVPYNTINVSLNTSQEDGLTVKKYFFMMEAL